MDGVFQTGFTTAEQLVKAGAGSPAVGNGAGHHINAEVCRATHQRFVHRVVVTGDQAAVLLAAHADKAVAGGQGGALAPVGTAALFEVAQAGFHLPDGFYPVAQVLVAAKADAGIVVGNTGGGGLVAAATAGRTHRFQRGADHPVQGNRAVLCMGRKCGEYGTGGQAQFEYGLLHGFSSICFRSLLLQ